VTPYQRACRLGVPANSPTSPQARSRRRPWTATASPPGHGTPASETCAQENRRPAATSRLGADAQEQGTRLWKDPRDSQPALRSGPDQPHGTAGLKTPAPCREAGSNGGAGHRSRSLPAKPALARGTEGARRRQMDPSHRPAGRTGGQPREVLRRTCGSVMMKGRHTSPLCVMQQGDAPGQ